MANSPTPASDAVVDRVAAALRSRIVAGELKPGTRIVEQALARDTGASRNTLREALRLLRTERLIEHVRHKGAVVRFVKPAEVIDIYKVRRALEIRALQESGVAAGDRLRQVREAIEQSEAALREGRWQDVGTGSLRFHQALVGLLDCQLLDEFFESTVAQMRLIFAVMADEGAFQSPWIPRDRAIHDAFVAGRRDEAIDRLRLYLDDSERATLDVVHAHHASD
nr:GntR family transcriptional regulator [Salinisphaera sp. Q1T1-3]